MPSKLPRLCMLVVCFAFLFAGMYTVTTLYGPHDKNWLGWLREGQRVDGSEMGREGAAFLMADAPTHWPSPGQETATANTVAMDSAEVSSSVAGFEEEAAVNHTRLLVVARTKDEDTSWIAEQLPGRATPSLPRHTWYFIATVTLSIINRPEEIKNVFEPALLQSASSAFSSVRDGDQVEGLKEKGGDKEDALMVARKTRDALVKSIPVGGLPKVSYVSRFLPLLSWFS